MGEALVKLHRLRNEQKNESKEKEMHPDEKRALALVREGARKHGATLATNGEGGLPASRVLGVMRRDGWRCKVCGTKKDLSLHHKGHLEHPDSEWLKHKAKDNNPNNIVTICTACHDKIHQEDRAKGDGGNNKNQQDN